jgi:hypothetical protein
MLCSVCHFPYELVDKDTPTQGYGCCGHFDELRMSIYFGYGSRLFDTATIDLNTRHMIARDVYLKDNDIICDLCAVEILQSSSGTLRATPEGMWNFMEAPQIAKWNDIGEMPNP